MKLTVNRVHCRGCRRFLFKFVTGSEVPFLAIHCKGCKGVNFIKIKPKYIQIVVENNPIYKEPEGEVDELKIKSIFKDQQKINIT